MSANKNTTATCILTAILLSITTTATLGAENGLRETETIRLLPTSSVLLVSDQVDGVADPQFFDEYYVSAMEYYGYAYTIWDHNALGSPTIGDLEPYSAIIWYTGNSGQYPADDPYFGHLTLSLGEEKTLETYLNTGDQDRLLVLSGMWIAWNCIANSDDHSQFYSPLFSALLGLSYIEDNFTDWIHVDDDWTLEGVGDQFYGTSSYEIIWASDFNYPDQLEAVSPGDATAIWVDADEEHHHYSCVYACGEKTIGSGEYHIALLSCPIESIGDQEERNEILHNLLMWGGTHLINIQPTSLGGIKSLFR